MRWAHLFLIFIIIPFSYAAEIKGNVYDYSLNLVTDVMVTIDTNPVQRVVSKDGSYSFFVPIGDYTINATKTYSFGHYYESSQKIRVTQEGSYTLDLILFPEVDDYEKVEFDYDVSYDTNQGNNKFMIVALILFLLLTSTAIVLFLFKRKPKKELFDDYEAQIISFIKKEGGRTTQKDIRKQIPLSEAKISLIIDGLDKKGVIEKIKKGRGNIIILKNK